MDGSTSMSQNRSGTCSSHGGVACWICPGALCEREGTGLDRDGTERDSATSENTSYRTSTHATVVEIARNQNTPRCRTSRTGRRRDPLPSIHCAGDESAWVPRLPPRAAQFCRLHDLPRLELRVSISIGTWSDWVGLKKGTYQVHRNPLASGETSDFSVSRDLASGPPSRWSTTGALRWTTFMACQPKLAPSGSASERRLEAAGVELRSVR